MKTTLMSFRGPAPVLHRKFLAGSIGLRNAWWCTAVLLLTCLARAAPAQEEGSASTPVRLRLVFSSRMFTDVHESDAKAAVKAWAAALARDRHIQAEPDAQVVDGLPALAAALETGQLDLITLTVDEYLSLGINPEQANVITGVTGGEYLVEYLLLVHRDADIRDLAGLKGRTVLMHENSLTCLAPPWLDTILLGKGLPPASAHFGQVTQVRKLSGVVLPVFFRRADACVVTRGGWETLSELNPQVGNQLRVMATSPRLLPSLSYIRVRSGEALAIDVQEEVESWHTTPSGKQLLNLFHVDRIVEIPASEIDGARQLLATYRRLKAHLGTGASRGALEGGER